LLAIEQAVECAIPVQVILPFALPLFKATSVVDRPGNWGELFDELITRPSDRVEVVTLNESGPSREAFNRTIEIMIRRASMPFSHERVVTLVWDGDDGGEGDATAEMGRMAAAAGFVHKDIPILQDS